MFFFTPFFSSISWFPIGSYSLVSLLQLPYGLGRGEGREPCVLRNTTQPSRTASWHNAHPTWKPMQLHSNQVYGWCHQSHKHCCCTYRFECISSTKPADASGLALRTVALDHVHWKHKVCCWPPSKRQTTGGITLYGIFASYLSPVCLMP